jgi:hypothetical protein
MERLTHDSYVVQATRLPEHRGRNPLNELLDLFEQRNFTNSEKTEKNYPYEPETAGVREMCTVLSGLVVNPEAREQVALELEYYRIMDAGFGDMGRDLTAAKKQIVEKDKVIEEKDNVIEEKDNVIKEKDELLAKLQDELSKLKSNQ